MSERNEARSRVAERKKAKRRKAIRNRIIFALVIVIIILLVVLVIKKVSSGSSDTTDTVAEVSGDDTTAPTITKKSDISVSVGDTISYRSYVDVTDDTDKAPVLDIDANSVDTTKAGTYEVTYTATDASGNSSSLKVTVTVAEKEEDNGDATEAEVSQMKSIAKSILENKIKVTDDMSDKDKALRIWLWVNWNCNYESSSDKSNWVRGALQFFNEVKGDCFNYYCAAKALLQEAGIQTQDIVKSDTSHSSHYWLLVNLGDGWYHYDATPRDGDGDFFFLVTDEQLDAYSEAHDNSHIFDHDAYPERATTVITDLSAQPDYYDYFSE